MGGKLSRGERVADALVEEGEKLKKEALHDYRRLKVHFGEGDQGLSKPCNAAKVRARAADNIAISHQFVPCITEPPVT